MGAAIHLTNDAERTRFRNTYDALHEVETMEESRCRKRRSTLGYHW